MLIVKTDVPTRPDLEVRCDDDIKDRMVSMIVDRKETNPKDAAATPRIDISLFPACAIVYGALGMAEGDLKYGGYNYRVAGVKVSVYIAACCRHLFKFFWCGEWADPKTKVPHLGNALACLAILVDGFEQGNIVDDRPPRQSSSLFDRAEAIMKHLQSIFPRKTPRYTEILHHGPEPGQENGL